MAAMREAISQDRFGAFADTFFRKQAAGI